MRIIPFRGTYLEGGAPSRFAHRRELLRQRLDPITIVPREPVTVEDPAVTDDPPTVEDPAAPTIADPELVQPSPTPTQAPGDLPEPDPEPEPTGQDAGAGEG